MSQAALSCYFHCSSLWALPQANLLATVTRASTNISFPRPMTGGLAIGVNALCTFQKDPNGPVLDRERLYWDLSNQTHGISMLGHYSLVKDSLYINGKQPHRGHCICPPFSSVIISILASFLGFLIFIQSLTYSRTISSPSLVEILAQDKLSP